MKRLLKNILLVAAVLLVAASCEKSPTHHENLSGIPILLTASEVGGTRALLDEESFATEGNELQIYDYYAPATETPYFYIEDQVRSNGSSWPFVKGNNNSGKYEWTTDGVHKFFGWLVKDNNSPGITSQEFFDDDFEFNKINHILTIPTTTLTQTGTQFDFMYSNIETRDLNTNPNFGPVEMKFKHLFTAFKVTAENHSTNTIKLRSVTIAGLKNSQSATIDYSAVDEPSGESSGESSNVIKEPIISYQVNDETTGTFTFNTETEGTETEGDETNKEGVELTSTPEPVSDGYIMMWPHSKDDFKTIGNPSTIIVVYDYIETDENGNATLTKNNETKIIQLSDVDMAAWEAGKKYDLNLQFKDKEIILKCTVQDWIPVEEVIDFTEQVSCSVPLTWEEGTVEDIIEEEGKVILYSNTSITAICRFKIDTPRGATWTASLISIEGHQDAFSIVEDSKYGPVGVECAIKIRVNNPDPIAPRHVCLLRITVQTADGRTIVVNNMMPEETTPNITEYSIIQNLING